jgi:hypothetical protein
MNETKNKHTPGPWIVGGVTANGGVVIMNDNTRPVAVVETCDDLEKRDVDATLIAAAPELLEALETAIADWDWDCSERTLNEETVIKMRSAIAKAKGE